jgi:hypothetical protein
MFWFHALFGSDMYCDYLSIEFGLVIRFIELLQLIATVKGYAVTVLHTSQVTIGHSRSSQSFTLSISCCLVEASAVDIFLPVGSQYCPQHQLPASHSNSSQQLNPSSYLTPTPILSCF